MRNFISSIRSSEARSRRLNYRGIAFSVEAFEVRVLPSSSSSLIAGMFPLELADQSDPFVKMIGTPFNGRDFTTQLIQSGPLIHLDQFRTDIRYSGFTGAGFSTVIIDTGIDLNHPFFGPDADQNGIADRIVYSYDFTRRNDSDATDFDGHGSNVASIAASSDSSYQGIAPAANIIALKVFPDNGNGASLSDIKEALTWVLDNVETYNIASVNMSLGFGNFTTATTGKLSAVLAELVAKNVIVVSASGNNFAEGKSDQGVSYPSADPNSLSVGAVFDADIGEISYVGGATSWTTAPDRITPFSQRSATLTTIFAPGAPITGAGATGGTLTEHGTSQASPQIAGVAVLAQQMASHYLGRRLTQTEFANLLKLTGDTIHDGDDENDNVINTGLDFKRVNVFNLAEAIEADQIPRIGDTVSVVHSKTFLLDANQNRSWDRPAGGDLKHKFGISAGIPLAGDFNGDGLDEIGVFNSGVWYLDFNGNGSWDGPSQGDRVYSFGSVSDLPTVGDWNDDGIDDIGTFSNGQWNLDANGNGIWDQVSGGDLTELFGTPGDLPTPGDWNGDGRSDLGVFRQGTWLLDTNANLQEDGPLNGDTLSTFGTGNDLPLVGDWNRSGKDQIGIFQEGRIKLDVDGSRTWNPTDELGDVTYQYGESEDLPIVGTWKASTASIHTAVIHTFDKVTLESLLASDLSVTQDSQVSKKSIQNSMHTTQKSTTISDQSLDRDSALVDPGSSRKSGKKNRAKQDRSEAHQQPDLSGSPKVLRLDHRDQLFRDQFFPSISEVFASWS